MSIWTNAVELGKSLFRKNYRNNVFGFDNDFEINQHNLCSPYEDGFIKSSDVYAINQMIAKNSKIVKWVLKKKTGDKIEEVTSGQLFDLIENPNPKQTREEFVEECSLNYTLSGNLFMYPEVAFGFQRPTSIKTLHPQLVRIKTKYVGKFNTVEKYCYYIGGREYEITPEEITHLKYYNPSDFGIETMRGLSPLTAGYLTLVGLNGNQVASASIYKHQGVAGILSNESDYALTPEQVKQQQKLLDDKISGATLFGKIIQSSAKVKYTKLGLDPSQLKLIDSKLLKMRDLCNIYEINSALMNDPDNKIYNNVIEAEKSFWIKCVIPNLKSIVKSYERAVVYKYNLAEFSTGKSKYFIELDLSGVEALQADKLNEATKNKLNAEAYSILLRDGVLTKEQIAVQLGFEFTPTNDTQSQDDKIRNAQAELRGTVGGVNGIIAINTAVSQGQISRESAVSILINVYGYDNVTANSMIT